MSAPYPRPESPIKRSEAKRRGVFWQSVLYVLVFIFILMGLVKTQRSISWYGITIVRTPR